MHIADLKHFLSRLWPFPRTPRTTIRVGRAGSPAPLLDFDPFWHGDHWQNLLSSPMDARHYVMEDWSVPSGEFETPRGARANERRNGRRRH